jgi:hypothetical protein
MNARVLLFAEAVTPNLSDEAPSLNIYGRDIFVVCAAVGAVALLLVLWAIFFRKTRGHRHRRYHHHRATDRWSGDAEGAEDLDADEDGDAAGAEPAQESHPRRRHRRRREHRPRNPTLAETGGLPPIRADKPPGMSPP